MDLEFDQLDLRYQGIRRRDPRRETQLLASLDALGQTAPVVVLPQVSGPYILLDGYKRLRALKRLRRDSLRATVWDMEEADALLLERLMRTSQAESPLEQGWLLGELRERFDMGLSELGRRFDRTPSWVSRRLALIKDLPDEVQVQVRSGRIAPHTAMKILVPLARANSRECLRFLEVLLQVVATTRQAALLKEGWIRGDKQVRERIKANPGLYLRVHGDPGGLQEDLGKLATVARRARGRLSEGLPERIPNKVLEQAQSECHDLFSQLEDQLNARRGHEDRHPAA